MICLQSTSQNLVVIRSKDNPPLADIYTEVSKVVEINYGN